MEWLLLMYFADFGHEEIIIKRYVSQKECVQVAISINNIKHEHKNYRDGRKDFKYQCIEVTKRLNK